MNLDEIFSLLDTIIANPNREEAFLRLTDEYMNQNELFRSTVRERWDFGIRWQIPNIIPPTNIKRTDTEQEAIIRANLIYFSISEKDELDENDMLIDIAVIYHKCLFIGVEPTGFFNSVAEESTHKIKKLLTNFIKRSDEEKSMEEFCLKTTKDENGNIDIECEFW
jgi:hypothetical protein